MSLYTKTFIARRKTARWPRRSEHGLVAVTRAEKQREGLCVEENSEMKSKMAEEEDEKRDWRRERR